jgi:hypothetical protein
MTLDNDSDFPPRGGISREQAKPHVRRRIRVSNEERFAREMPADASLDNWRNCITNDFIARAVV